MIDDAYVILKKAFALAYLENKDEAFKIANILFPDNPAFAFQISKEWPEDEIVLEFLDEFKADVKGNLPTKEDAAAKAWGWTNTFEDPEHKLAALSEFNELMGYTGKNSGITINNQTVNKVMVIKEMGTMDEWEKKAIRQQKALLDVSESKH